MKLLHDTTKSIHDVVKRFGPPKLQCTQLQKHPLLAARSENAMDSSSMRAGNPVRHRIGNHSQKQKNALKTFVLLKLGLHGCPIVAAQTVQHHECGVGDNCFTSRCGRLVEHLQFPTHHTDSSMVFFFKNRKSRMGLVRAVSMPRNAMEIVSAPSPCNWSVFRTSWHH